jgi:hypothetical protein
VNTKFNWDALGIAASLACAIHCAILPLLLSSLPLFGINLIDNMSFEFFMILAAFLIGINSLSHGYKKHHKKIGPSVLFSLGIIFMISKQIWHNWQLFFLIPAVISIISAHFWNYRLIKKSNACISKTCSH